MLIPIKGIAATFSLELAMLFSRTGIELYCLGIGDFSEWVPVKAIETIIKKKIFCLSRIPKSVAGINRFDMTFIIGSHFNSVNEISKLLSADEPLAAFLKEKTSKTLIIKPPSDSNPFVSERGLIDILELPEAYEKYLSFFQQIFSKTIRFFHNTRQNKKLGFCLKLIEPENVSEDFSILSLVTALKESGFYTDDLDYSLLVRVFKSNDEKTMIVFQNETKVADFTLNLIPTCFKFSLFSDYISKRCVFVQSHKNGLILFDADGVRLLPELTNHSCFARLSDYLIDKI